MNAKGLVGGVLATIMLAGAVAMKVRVTLPLVLYTINVLLMATVAVRTSLEYRFGDLIPLLW